MGRRFRPQAVRALQRTPELYVGTKSRRRAPNRRASDTPAIRCVVPVPVEVGRIWPEALEPLARRLTGVTSRWGTLYASPGSRSLGCTGYRADAGAASARQCLSGSTRLCRRIPVRALEPGVRIRPARVERSRL